MARINRTSAAETDLANIWSYIAADNPTAADKLLAEIDAAFALIATTPDIGFLVEDMKPSMRCKPIRRNYLIFYRIIGDEVYVARVLHAARKYEDLL